MAKKKLTEEQEKEIKILQANNEMLQKTKEEAKLRGNMDSVKRIELAQNDVVEQMKKIDANEAKKLAAASKNREEEESAVQRMLKSSKDDEIESVFDKIKRNESKTKNSDTATKVEEKTNSYEFNNIDMEAQYDIVSLPSNGECYKGKMGRIPVSYLTAYDENFITSPNLYKDGLIIDFLLKHKIMNSDVDIDELCKGDVDAIVLFLRMTSYGTDFPITVRDPQSGESIEYNVDLSTLKMKDFDLKGDENGWFEYELPISKDKVKFKFLTRKDEKDLDMLSQMDTEAARVTTLSRIATMLTNAVKSDTVLSGKEKQEYKNYADKIKAWSDKISETNPRPYSKLITNRLELAIMSVNGDTDRDYIAKYVHNMNAMDSLKLRRYMLENEPGIDFEIEIERPESLGGGSFKTFLEWDDAVFLNIA